MHLFLHKRLIMVKMHGSLWCLSFCILLCTCLIIKHSITDELHYIVLCSKIDILCVQNATHNTANTDRRQICQVTADSSK
jgi:hypothetical protein